MVSAQILEMPQPPERVLSPERPLRVLLDARKLEHGGIGTYTRNLVAGLLSQSAVELTLIVNSQSSIKYEWARWVEFIEDRAKPYSIAEMLALPRRVDFSRFDLYHTPHYTLPYGIPIPSVVTIHDLIHIYFPERPFYPWIAKRLIRSAIRRASKVLTVSQATRADLLNFLGNDLSLGGKISVIPNAIDPFFIKRVSEHMQNPAEYLASRFGLQGKYFLCVASNSKPHKGLPDLLNAFSELERRRSSGELRADPRKRKIHKALTDLKLVVVGAGSQGLLESPELRGSVYVFGMVSAEDLAYLYAGAQALVVPSLSEGFCLPVLEAQIFGTRVVTRPVPAILELLTERDTSCRDFSVGALSDAMVGFFEQGAVSGFQPSAAAALRTREGYLVQDIGRAALQSYQQALADR